MGRPRKKDKPLCPRCGSPIDYFDRVKRGNRVYLYAVHYEGYTRVGSKIRKRVRKCYLGPEDAYTYVSRTHVREGLVLRGAHDPERVLDYLTALIHYLENPELDLSSQLLKRIAAKLRELADSLEDIARVEEEEA